MTVTEGASCAAFGPAGRRKVDHGSITGADPANPAVRLGRETRWDPAAARTVGDDEAGRMFSRPIREPWRAQEARNREDAGGFDGWETAR